MNTLISKDTITQCYHCGNQCTDEDILLDEKHFCCSGCSTVYEILKDNELCGYYDLNQNSGVSLKAKNFNGKFDYLNEPSVEKELLAFQSANISKVILNIPSIHCSSCVWLLENFHKILEGVESSRLNFVKKDLSISYNPQITTLKDIVELLATLGYEPQINFEGSTHSKGIDPETKRLLFRIGVVGFCAGNIMLMSFPEYFSFNMENRSDATYQKFFLYFNFLLSLPVFFYGASDYLKGAYYSIVENLRKNSNVLSVDIPIAMGITALFLRSTYETFVNQTAGYWDSMAGLVLFLLVGKWVQQVTFNYLSFERSYKSYFPLAVKIKSQEKKYKNVKDLVKGDQMVIHHQELIPADAILTKGSALIDYSFVTGETKPVKKIEGDFIYAGGRQMAEAIELEVQKPVSTSYLTQLWNNESFLKEKTIPTTQLANNFSKYFTYITIALSFAAGVYWYFNDKSLIMPAVTAILMVACPCALTLSMPFTMNTTMSIFGKNKFYVKNQSVIQILTEVDTIVFDKTGTLTETNHGDVRFEGEALSETEKDFVFSLSSQSLHPLSKLVSEALKGQKVQKTEYFKEIKGKGIEAFIDGKPVRIGKADFVRSQAIPAQDTEVHISIDNQYKGYFTVEPLFRNNWKKLLQKLKKTFDLHLISGDVDKMKDVLSQVFGSKMQFDQSPQNKLDYIKGLENEGKNVVMIGDGLNDAGALRQAKIGIALSEDIQAFSPSCDAILDANKFEQLGEYVRFSKTALNIVKITFLLSLVYNFFGISWAATGQLSPVLAAIFMPLSTLSVVLLGVGLTFLVAKNRKLL